MRAKPWLALLPWLALVSAEPDEGGILPLPSGGTPSLHPEIPGFHSFRPEELKQNFVGSLNFFREFGAVRFQSETDEEQLGDLQIWLNYAVAFSDHNWSVRDCPFANFIRRTKNQWGGVLYLWSLCTIVDGLPHRDHVEWKATGEPVCQELRDAPISLARELFGRDHSSWGLRSWEQIYVFMNTRFADLMTMWVRPAEEAIRIVAPHVEPGVDCELQEEFPSGWDWKGHLTRMSDPSESYHDAIHYTLNPHAMQNMEGKVQECPMGWLALLVHQMLICMGGLTEQAAFSAAMLEKSFFLIEQETRRLYSTDRIDCDKGINWVLHALLKTRWPINRFFFSTGLMVQARRFVDDQPRYQHKPYELDFHPSELLYPFDERHQLPHGFSVAALRQRRSGFGRSESYAQLLRALEMSVTRAGLVGGRPVVMFTLVYGERYARYLANWIRRSAAFGHEARTENGKGTTFRLDDIMRHWGAGQNISKEDVQRAIQKFMFHENGTDMRFSLTEDSQGHKVFIANSRSRDKGKGKGFGFKGDVFGFKGGKIGFKGRSRSPRSPVRRNGRRPEGRRSDRRGDASSDGSATRGGARALRWTREALQRLVQEARTVERRQEEDFLL
eukprot:g15952.t1